MNKIHGILLGSLFLSTPLYAQSWEGNYASQEKLNEEGIWSGNLEIKNCVDKNCEYDWRSGSNQSGCASSGKFIIKSELSAEDIVATEGDTGKKDKESCNVTLTRSTSKNEITVDGNGDGCDELCGAQGARYFGVNLKYQFWYYISAIGGFDVISPQAYSSFGLCRLYYMVTYFL